MSVVAIKTLIQLVGCLVLKYVEFAQAEAKKNNIDDSNEYCTGIQVQSLFNNILLN